MSVISSSNGGTHLYLNPVLSILAALGLAGALSCGSSGSGDSGSNSDSDSATQARDVEFGRTIVTIDDFSLSFCPINGTRLVYRASSNTAMLERAHVSTLSHHGQSASFPSNLGKFRAGPGAQVCASVAAGNWQDTGEVCHTIEVATKELTFPFELSRGECKILIDLAADVSIFDAQAFCQASCTQLRSCGRNEQGCVAACASDIQSVSAEDDATCHQPTLDWLTCLHTADCKHDPALYCEFISKDYTAQDALFSSGQCVRPALPPPPPDPLACNPQQTDLVAGTVGDFYVIAKTSDAPNEHYAIIDLSQLGEIDQVLAANPNDPVLSSARSILPALRGFDGSSRDHCRENGIVALRFAVDLNIARNAYANLDDNIRALQRALERLARLAEELKKAAVAFFMDEIVCPLTHQAFSLIPNPAGTIAGVAAAASLGCI